jgi:hypothetical protein
MQFSFAHNAPKGSARPLRKIVFNKGRTQCDETLEVNLSRDRQLLQSRKSHRRLF